MVRHRMIPRLLNLETRLSPAVFTVLNLNNSGADSLRNCVQQANGTAGADTIEFTTGLTGTITLVNDIGINDPLTITGPGVGKLTINGNGAVRIFDTSAAAGGTVVKFSKMTLTGGSSVNGGAVNIGDEVVSFTNCVLTDNHASGLGGAIYLDTSSA